MSNNHIKMDPINDKYGLKIGFWDVNSLPEENSKEDFFLKQIQFFDIILLSEAWHREDSADKMLHLDTIMKIYTEKIKNGKEERLGVF